ncbi:efflux RND transporter periplasmic adaptor subunit [Winogradskyella aurantia]|uniref:Efflux transporter periplasmic adaptor subunit n=1 Tax=Winogradskyella aurantia TaxID=1915063 RepID=A0A265UWK1_9FLAO|nr:efflux RND transporter periplasmic adaptor subunit [Winogradskyella aurantia]OZV69689.1 efflux transporter periplasmic adaptor subunit [Winogradskyella aurantia]
MNTKHIYKIIALSVILSLVSCKEDDKKITLNDATPITVSVETVTSNSDNSALTVSGSIEATNNATLSTRLMGYVDRIYVDVGDVVTKGQLLLSINSSDLKAKSAQVTASITEANAAFQNAEKDYQRFKNLFEENSASQKELDDITARYNMAKARLEAAKQMKNEVDAQFAYTNIRAPFKGIVAAKYIEAGTLANPGMPLLSVESPDNFDVMVRVPEHVISKVKPNMDVRINVSSINARFNGKVKEVSASSTLSGGQYLVKITLKEPTKNIRSGMFASVEFPTIEGDIASASQSIFIPTKALVHKGQLTGLYTVSQQNTAILRWIRIGRSMGENTEVLSGLTAGETIITSSQGKLYNGAKLNIK